MQPMVPRAATSDSTISWLVAEIALELWSWHSGNWKLEVLLSLAVCRLGRKARRSSPGDLNRGDGSADLS